MKYISILLILLVVANGANMRHKKQLKETNTKQNLVQMKTEFVGEAQDLSQNVGVISVEEVISNQLTNQDRITKAETQERNAIHKAINKAKQQKAFVQIDQLIDNQPFIEETLDETPQKEFNFADLYTNDGSSPDMGNSPIVEDLPSAPMAQIPTDDNLEYIRTIDKLDLLDENGNPLQLLPEELSLLQMTQFESRFQATETPEMEQEPVWDMQQIEAAYEKTPGQSELSDDELQRQTNLMVDSLRREIDDVDDI